MRILVRGEYPYQNAPHWSGILEGIRELGHEPIPVGPAESAPEHDISIFGSFYEGSPTCYWFCDYIHKDISPMNAPVYFTYREHAKRFGGRWLPQASIRRAEIDRSDPNDKIIFIGQKYPNVEYHDLYTDRQLLIDGTNAEVICGSTKDERSQVFSRLGNICGNAGVILGCDGAKHLDFGMSNRVFNVLGAGGFYCTIYTKGMEDVFENGKHLVWGEDVNSTIKLAKYYQANQDEAREIAEEGFRYVQSEHIYSKRIERILSDVR